MSVLLDTHVWLWWLVLDSRLSEQERQALAEQAESGELFLAAISLWEVQVAHTKRRVRLPVSFAEWLMRATAENVVKLLPLDQTVVLALEDLPTSFHGDPADRLIVATARAYKLPLATHDDNIRRSRAVRLWRP